MLGLIVRLLPAAGARVGIRIRPPLLRPPTARAPRPKPEPRPEPRSRPEGRRQPDGSKDRGGEGGDRRSTRVAASDTDVNVTTDRPRRPAGRSPAREPGRRPAPAVAATGGRRPAGTIGGATAAAGAAAVAAGQPGVARTGERKGHAKRARRSGDRFGRPIPRRLLPWQVPAEGAGSTGRIVVRPAFLLELQQALTGHLATADEVDRLARRQVESLDVEGLVVAGDHERAVRRLAHDAVVDHAGTRRLPPLLTRDVGYVVDALARAVHMDEAGAFGPGAVGALVATLSPSVPPTTRSRVRRYLTALEPPRRLPTTPVPCPPEVA